MKTLNQFTRSKDGAVLIEFALSFPILAFLLISAFQFGLALNTKSALDRATSDSVRFLSSLPPAGDYYSTPHTMDYLAVQNILDAETASLGTDLTAKISLVTAGFGAKDVTGHVTLNGDIYQSGNVSECSLEQSPDLSGLSLAAGERVVIVQTCIKWHAAFHSVTRQMRSTRIIPLSTPIATSCNELYAVHNIREDGVYVIDPISGDGNALPVFCDMKDGGWTMVAAQFEGTAESNWNQGHRGSYDPSLRTAASFTLKSSEIPQNTTQTAFGQNFDATFVGSFDMTYDPAAQIDMTGSNDGFVLYRSADSHYQLPSSDPEDPDLNPAASGSVKTSSPADWNNCLVLDRSDTTSHLWWFCPNATQANRGAGMNGDQMGISDSGAWTIWVK